MAVSRRTKRSQRAVENPASIVPAATGGKKSPGKVYTEYPALKRNILSGPELHHFSLKRLCFL